MVEIDDQRKKSAEKKLIFDLYPVRWILFYLDIDAKAANVQKLIAAEHTPRLVATFEKRRSAPHHAMFSFNDFLHD